MRQYRIEITALAEQDLENAGDYIAYKLLNPSAAERTVRGIRNQINKLQNFPERNGVEKDSFLTELGVRMERYRNYKIYYLVDNSNLIVYIIRILHMLEDSQMWLYRTLGLTEPINL